MGLVLQTTKTLRLSLHLFSRQNQFKTTQTRENSNKLHKGLIC